MKVENNATLIRAAMEATYGPQPLKVVYDFCDRFYVLAVVLVNDKSMGLYTHKSPVYDEGTPVHRIQIDARFHSASVKTQFGADYIERDPGMLSRRREEEKKNNASKIK